ncbi:MAG: RNA-binding S4 domain-containing protein [Acidimicrobiia bacterium]
MESARIDRWLWSVRLTATRSDATDACTGGHVQIGGRNAKPASHVSPGDRVEARLYGRDRIVEVVRPIDKRVGAPVAVTCYVDHSPPPEETERAWFAERDRGTGRPTKRDRRQLDRWRSR